MIPEEAKEIADLKHDIAEYVRISAEQATEIEQLRAVVKKAIAAYGKPGGPWNVPSEPGTWIAMAREAVGDIPKPST